MFGPELHSNSSNGFSLRKERKSSIKAITSLWEENVTSDSPVPLSLSSQKTLLSENCILTLSPFLIVIALENFLLQASLVPLRSFKYLSSPRSSENSPRGITRNTASTFLWRGLTASKDDSSRLRVLLGRNEQPPNIVECGANTEPVLYSGAKEMQTSTQDK